MFIYNVIIYNNIVIYKNAHPLPHIFHFKLFICFASVFRTHVNLAPSSTASLIPNAFVRASCNFVAWRRTFLKNPNEAISDTLSKRENKNACNANHGKFGIMCFEQWTTIESD